MIRNQSTARIAMAMLGVAALGLAGCSSSADTMAKPAPMAMAPQGPTDPMVGGAAMYPAKNIVQNAVNSKDHTTLVAAVKQAGLVSTLEGPGPFTVFAPTNEAFDALPAGTVNALMQPSAKKKLTRILTYHVVAGKLDSKALDADIAAGGGKAVLTTVEGGKLTVTKDAMGGLLITDAHGDVAHVTIPDVYQSNGVIMVVDHVLLPPSPMMHHHWRHHHHAM